MIRSAPLGAQRAPRRRRPPGAAGSGAGRGGWRRVRAGVQKGREAGSHPRGAGRESSPGCRTVRALAACAVRYCIILLYSFLFYCPGGDAVYERSARGWRWLVQLSPRSAAGLVSLRRVDVALSPQRWHWMSFAFSWDIVFHPLGSPAPGWYSCKSFPFRIHSPLVCCGFVFSAREEGGSLSGVGGNSLLQCGEALAQEKNCECPIPGSV